MTIRSYRPTTLLLLAGALTAAGAVYAEDPPAKDPGSPPQAVQGIDQAPPQAPKPQDAQPDPQKMETAKPMIQSVMPVSAPAATKVHIMGSNLSAVTQVLFGGARDASFKVLNDTEIEATVPAGAKEGPIELVTPTGTVKSTVAFHPSY